MSDTPLNKSFSTWQGLQAALWTGVAFSNCFQKKNSRRLKPHQYPISTSGVCDRPVQD